VTPGGAPTTGTGVGWAATIHLQRMKSPGGEAGRIPALVRNRRQPIDPLGDVDCESGCRSGA